MLHPQRHFELIESLESRTLLAVDFTVVAMSDTQYTVESFPQTFQAQTQWAADHASDPNYNIAFLAHQGDMLRRGYSNAQAATAAAALSVLNGKVPYAVSIGNHDFDNQFDDLDHHVSSANFTSWFGDDLYASIPGSGFGGSSLDQRNRYQIFSGAGRQYLLLSMEWEAEDSAIAWAQGVINSHRQLPVILTTHEYLNSGGRTTSPLDPAGNDGQDIFQKLVSPNPQIFLVLSGHTGAIRHQTSTNASTNPDYASVFETVGDFESRPNGGSGYFQLFHFYPAQNTINVSTYSPTLNQFDTSSSTYQFSLSIDFAKRFGFANGVIGNDDAFTILPGQSLFGSVTANDYDSAASPLVASLASGPAHGSLTLNLDGTFSYIPAPGFHGIDSFSYTASNGTNTSNAAQVLVQVNTPPTGAGESAATFDGKSIVLNVIANDSDADSDSLRPILSDLPAFGAAFANSDGTFTYTPDPKFTGPDAFSYLLTDGKQVRGPFQVNISVLAGSPTYAYPIGETTTSGTRTGSYANLSASDGLEETIREVTKSGSAVLDQRWQFNVTAGTEITFAIKAKRSLGTDEYHFQYSTNGSTWLELTQFVAASSRDVTRVLYDADEPYQMWALPATTTGTVWIRATDTKSNTDLCSLIVDEMFIRSAGADAAPAAPSSLSASYNKGRRKTTLQWTDNSSNETGFRIWYSTDSGQTWLSYSPLAANSTSFTSPQLTRGVTYLFRVTSFNSLGESASSNKVLLFAT